MTPIRTAAIAVALVLGASACGSSGGSPFERSAATTTTVEDPYRDLRSWYRKVMDRRQAVARSLVHVFESNTLNEMSYACTDLLYAIEHVLDLEPAPDSRMERLHTQAMETTHSGARACMDGAYATAFERFEEGHAQLVEADDYMDIAL